MKLSRCKSSCRQTPEEMRVAPQTSSGHNSLQLLTHASLCTRQSAFWHARLHARGKRQAAELPVHCAQACGRAGRQAGRHQRPATSDQQQGHHLAAPRTCSTAPGGSARSAAAPQPAACSCRMYCQLMRWRCCPAADARQPAGPQTAAYAALAAAEAQPRLSAGHQGSLHLQPSLQRLHPGSRQQAAAAPQRRLHPTERSHRLLKCAGIHFPRRCLCRIGQRPRDELSRNRN